MKATETRNTQEASVLVKAVFQDGTDLEEELVSKCQRRVYLKKDVELISQVGWMVLTLQLLKAK